MTFLPSIDLQIYEQLEERAFRKAFFIAETSGLIARQLMACRERRQLNQSQLAEEAGTHQPAISRVESAEYRSWSFKTLVKLADALDARLRVLIEPWEDVRDEYMEPASTDAVPSDTSVLDTISASVGLIQNTIGNQEEMYGLGKHRHQQGVFSRPTGAPERATVSSAGRVGGSQALYLSGRANQL